MLKMVDGTGIIGVDMICPLGVSAPQPPNYDRVELEGAGMLVLPNSLDAPLERLELGGKTEQVQTSGKNLFNGKILAGKYPTDDMNIYEDKPTTNIFDKPVEIKPDTEYIISADGRLVEGNIYIYDEAGKKITEHYSGKFTSPSNAKYVVASGSNTYMTVNSAVQIEYGSTISSYEPYTGGKPSPSPEYLQEIKNVGKWNEETQKYEVDVKITNAEQNWSKEQTLTLTSDRPITKWDRLVEQGGEIGWLYQSKIVSLTGGEEWKTSLNAFYTTTYNFIKDYEAKCSHYVLAGITNQEKNNIFSIGEGAYANSLWIRDTSFSAVQDFKAHLSDLNEKGDPIMVVSPAAQTEFVPLPQSEQNAIRALKTYYPTTVITVDGGELDPDIKVTYRKEI